MKKITLTLTMILLFSTFLNAQNYDQLWLKVERLEVNNLPKSANKIVDEIYSKAEKENNAPQIIKSLFYKSKFSLILEEDAQLKVIDNFKKHIATSEFPTKNVLENILANLYWQYFNKNRYKFYRRTNTSTKVSPNDFRTWDLDTLFEEIHTYFNASLSDGKKLQNIHIDTFTDILNIQKDAETYHPTLFDFLANNALTFYKTSENSITKPAYQFKIDNEDFLNDASTFSNLNITSKDSISLQLNALKVYQKLLKFHLENKTYDALAYTDVHRINFVKQHATFEDIEKKTLQTFITSEKQLKNHKASGIYTFEIANIYNQQASRYSYSKNEDYRFKNQEALSLCNNIIKKHPKSLGAKKCIVLKNNIESESLQITAEKNIPINKNSRLLVKYKNIDKLFFSAYKISANQNKKLQEIYKAAERIEFINSLEKTNQWTSNLRNENDYLQHTTEVVVPKLQKGQYLIVTSIKETLDVKNIYGTSQTQVTNLVLIQNNFNNTTHYQVVDRNTGKPIPNASIHLKNTKKYKNDHYINKKLTTDKNGFVSFVNNKYYSQVTATITTKNDKATFGNQYLSKNNHNDANEIDDEITVTPFIFTDRSIYRPGQKVFFKAIVIKKQLEKATVLKNEFVEVSLYDANHQTVKTLELQLNEFGSVAGEFQLPNNGITGEFTIEIDEGYEHDSTFYDQDNLYFYTQEKTISVEEYKRPKFATEFKPVTETYRVNDSIKVIGFAKAFSGTNITNADVEYRVHRKVQYPSWYYWYRPNINTSSQEITYDYIETNEKGEFEVVFKALPDESVDKKSLPIFTYEITADVTDINGETRSATTTVKVGYHALVANINIDTKINKNEKNTFTINTLNLNDEFVPAKGSLKIYKLEAPKNPQRLRPWSAPDYQDISEIEFRKLFPNDPYKDDESNEKSWKKGKVVFDKNFDTAASKEFHLKNTKKWDSGKYIIILESKDAFGQTVKDEKRFSLFSTKENTVPDSKLIIVNTDKVFYKPNENVLLQIGSASKDISVVVQIEKAHKIVQTSILHLNNEVKTLKIPVTQNDIGGFAIKYHFVNYNSFKSDNISINVPQKQEAFELVTNVFRDKLQPGQDETWSFTLKNDKNDKIAAEVLASMYDASLDEFKSHSWQFNPITPKLNYYSYQTSNASSSFGINFFRISNTHQTLYHYPNIALNQYNWFGFSLTNSHWTQRNYLNEVKHKLENERTEFDGVVSGTVTSSADNEPLPGVSIYINGTPFGEASDFDGNFSIKVKKDDVLVFSSVGFKSKEINLDGSFTKLNIQLEEDANALDEVVVVGYGTQKRQSLTGAVSKISAMAVEDSLQGRVSGVSIQKEGVAGKNTKIMIRGAASVKGTNTPLYVVDGVILDSFNVNENEITSLEILKDASSTAIYGSRGANGVILITTKTGQAKIDKELASVKARTNLKETAFFFPQLKTNKNGEVSFNFTAPEALTRWKLQLLAHTPDAKHAFKTLQTVTQKELMVVPNAPRFLRQGDAIVLSAKISNLSDKILNGFAQLQLTDAITGKEINTDLQNTHKNKEFTVDSNGNTNVSWELKIPYTLQSVQYKIVAKAGDFSDGEQNVLPVLTNRMLVTETLPMWVRSNQTKTFSLDKLKNNNSSTLVNHKLTLEVTSNPAWYAIQALPYLMEYPYECAEQTFSRFYANTIASFVANSNSKIQEVFNAWKSSDALLSNLEKNQELKSLIIQETPWLRDAQSENEQKKRIALLFDLSKMKNEQEKAILKLQDIQKNTGGFPWFKGGRYESDFITQHIATGFGHLKKLGISNFDKSTEKMIYNAVAYLDTKLSKRYKDVLKNASFRKNQAKNKDEGEKAYNSYLASNQLNYFTLQYLYMRSFYKDIKIPKKTQKAFDYYTNQSITYWNDYNLYAKGQIALSLFRNNQKHIAYKIIKSLKENSITSDELGMYWKENTAGYYYYQAPVETQALLIETFAEIENNTETIDNLKIWLLKNKQTNRWKTTKSTTEAVYALLLNGSDWISVEETVAIKVGDTNINPNTMEEVKVEAGTGYFKTSWNREEITQKMSEVTISKKEKGIAWGGLYWQYFEDLDKITSAETPLKLDKKLFLKTNSDTGKELQEINEKTNLKVGDLITVRIELRSDRNMEFIHMKDMRASGVEPINVLSQYKYQDGLSYYESTKDAATNFFFDRLPKGVYVFEYDVRVNNAGDFSNGITTIQSMYAPEFSSHSKGERININ